MVDPLQQFNAIIARLSEAIKSQQQELIDFKGKFETLAYWAIEVDIQEWYSQS